MRILKSSLSFLILCLFVFVSLFGRPIKLEPRMHNEDIKEESIAFEVSPNPANRNGDLFLQLPEDDLIFMMHDDNSQLIMHKVLDENSIDLKSMELEVGQYTITLVSNEGNSYSPKLVLE